MKSEKQEEEHEQFLVAKLSSAKKEPCVVEDGQKLISFRTSALAKGMEAR